MKSVRNEIKHIMRVVAILATLLTMSYVLADSASAIVIGPLGNPTVIQTPVQSVVRPSIGLQPLGVSSIVRPPVFNPFFRPAFNPFFRPAFNPFFRPPIFNPFFGADLDDLGLGLGLGIGEVGIGD
jgi:hypothetical protein